MNSEEIFYISIAVIISVFMILFFGIIVSADTETTRLKQECIIKAHDPLTCNLTR